MVPRILTAAVATCALAAAAAVPAAAVTTTWPMNHLTPLRWGDDTDEPGLSGAVHAFTSPALDGALYAEPLVYSGHVIVATENDTVYSLDAQSGGVTWSRHLGTPRTSNFPCGDIDPLGITGTPVINGTSVYAVAEIQDSATAFHWELSQVDLATGNLVFSANVTPPGMDPNVQQQRAALAVANGRVIVAYGGLDGDCGDYHGWVVSYPANNSGALESWQVPTAREGGIWATPGPAVDSSGNVYVAIGNGSATGGAWDGSDSVTALTSNMQRIDYFAPSSWPSDNASDLDLGSTTPIVLSNGLLFQAGKSGVGYMLDASHLGGIGGQLYSGGRICSGEAIGGNAYDGANTVYVSCDNGITAVRIDSGPSYTVLWHTATGATGPPILAGGAVWSESPGAGRLYGLDPGSGQPLATLSTGAVNRFVTPTSAGGHLYVAGSGNVVVGFAPQTGPAPPGGGYDVDAYGGVHPFGGALVAGISAYWNGVQLAHAIVMRPDRDSGYVVDAYGGLHPFGNAPNPVVSAYFANWNIIRGAVLDPCDAAGTSGWTLDGYGGMHPFGGAPAVKLTSYFGGWDIARGVADSGCSGGHAAGYVLDGWGGLHPFSEQGQPLPAVPAGSAYWSGWDIATGIVATGAGTGYVLDGWGGVHAFGSAAPAVTTAYWRGWRIAHAITWNPTLGGGYTLDGWGGLHPWWPQGHAQIPPPVLTAYWKGWDIARAAAG